MIKRNGSGVLGQLSRITCLSERPHLLLLSGHLFAFCTAPFEKEAVHIYTTLPGELCFFHVMGPTLQFVMSHSKVTLGTPDSITPELKTNITNSYIFTLNQCLSNVMLYVKETILRAAVELVPPSVSCAISVSIAIESRFQMCFHSVKSLRSTPATTTSAVPHPLCWAMQTFTPTVRHYDFKHSVIL